MTCIGEFIPGNKTIWVVFDEESEFSGPRTPKLRLDQVFLKEKRPYNNLLFNYAQTLIVVVIRVVNFFGFLVIARYPTMRF